MNLLAIQKGNMAYITDLTNVPFIIKQRLMHMGICEGCHIKLRQLMPFGGPCVLEYSGQAIGIRRADAKKVLVKIK